MIFTPSKKGETTVTIRDKEGDIRLILKVVISESNLTRRVQELRDLLKDIEGIEISIVADKIVVDGEVVVLGDLNRLYAVLSDSSYKDIVMNLVTVSPIGLQILGQKIQAEINNPAVKVRVLNGMFMLEGQVDTAAQRDAAVSAARNMVQGFALPTFALQGANTPIDIRRAAVRDPIVDRISVAPRKPDPPAKMVRITVDFVELSKDYLRNFGFSWIPTLSTDSGSISFGTSTTGGVTSQGNGSISATIGNLFPKLSTAQNAGYARILEESVIVVKQNQSGRIERKMKLPVPFQTITNGAVQTGYNYPTIGLELSIVPTVKAQSEDIELNMDFHYDGLAGRTSDQPIILTHAYKGDVVVKSSESAAVVNMISNTIATNFNKDPPGGMPASPLFTLLRSKAFQKNKSQFVVFVTPQLIESSSGGTEDIKNRYGLKRKL